MKFFRHIEPLQYSGGELLSPASDLLQAPAPTGKSAILMASLSQGALLLYRGVYTLETEYLFVAAEGERLPWFTDYWEEPTDHDPDLLIPKPIKAEEFAAIVDEIRSIANEPQSGFPFEAATLGSDRAGSSGQLATQYFAVEALVCLDEALDLLLRGQAAEVVPWFGQAYRNLISASSQVAHFVHGVSAVARAAAYERHRPNRQNRAKVIEWYLANKDKFSSMDQAAEAAANRVAHVSFRTAREWIGQANRDLRFTRRP